MDSLPAAVGNLADSTMPPSFSKPMALSTPP